MASRRRNFEGELGQLGAIYQWVVLEHSCRVTGNLAGAEAARLKRMKTELRLVADLQSHYEIPTSFSANARLFLLVCALAGDGLVPAFVPRLPGPLGRPRKAPVPKQPVGRPRKDVELKLLLESIIRIRKERRLVGRGANRLAIQALAKELGREDGRGSRRLSDQRVQRLSRLISEAKRRFPEIAAKIEK